MKDIFLTLKAFTKLGNLKQLKQILSSYELSNEAQFEVLSLAAYHGHLHIVKFLIEKKKFDPDYSDDLLFTAIRQGHFKITRYLIEKANFDVHESSEKAFLLAAKCDRFKILRYLVEKHNVDIHINNDQAIVKAAQSGNIKLLEYLTDKGLDLRADLDSAVLGAAKGGHIHMLKYLMSKGLDLHTKDNKAMAEAARKGHLHMVKYLQGRKLNIHTYRDAALHFAVSPYAKQYHVMSYFMDHNCISEAYPCFSLQKFHHYYREIENWFLSTAHPRVHKFPLSRLDKMINIKNNRIKKHEVMEMIYCTYDIPEDIVRVLATVMLNREFKPHEFYHIKKPTPLNLDIQDRVKFYYEQYSQLTSTWLALIEGNQVEKNSAAIQ